jgi:hypothetical protein
MIVKETLEQKCQVQSCGTVYKNERMNENICLSMYMVESGYGLA